MAPLQSIMGWLRVREHLVSGFLAFPSYTRHVVRRSKGSISTTDANHTIANSLAKDIFDDTSTVPVEVSQDIERPHKDIAIDSTLAPTDSRLESLCHAKIPKLTSRRGIGQPTPETHPHLLGQLQITPGISKFEFKERRRRMLRLISNTAAGKKFDKHAIIILGSPMKIMSGDIPYPFHQNSDFLYLTGFKEPDAALILETKENDPLPDHNMIMFVKPRDPRREIWDGPVSGLDAAISFFGASESYPISSLSSIINERYGGNRHCLWYNLADNTTNPRLHSEIMNLLNTKKFQYPALQSLGHNLQILRMIKSNQEIELMKKSANIASNAFSRVMLSSRPGLEEHILHAIFEYECKIHGAQLLAFPPVVASGLSANTLHYISNAHIARDGDLMLMDAGCEYNGYVSDITRTWPVNGKFTLEQKELYEIVLRVQMKCIELCKVGVSLDEIHQQMISTLGIELQNIGFIPENLTERELRKAVAEFCPHHVGHYLGMDTHDTPLIHRGIPLQSGMVITIEPGIYIPKNMYHVPEKFRGIGIRIEDDILITDNGPYVLSGDCPKQVQDIEDLLMLRKTR